MSTGADCVFTENRDGTWGYRIQRYPYGEWPEYDEHGPFGTKDGAVAHLNANYANPGGWSNVFHPDLCKHETVRDGRCIRCGKEMGRTGFTVTGGGPLRRSRLL